MYLKFMLSSWHNSLLYASEDSISSVSPGEKRCHWIPYRILCNGELQKRLEARFYLLGHLSAPCLVSLSSRILSFMRNATID